MEEVPAADGSDPLRVSGCELHRGPGAGPVPEPATPSSSPSSPCASGPPRPHSPPGSPCASRPPRPHSPPGSAVSAVSALQSKVKALSERRAAGRDRDDRGPAGQTPAPLSAASGQPQAVKRAPPAVLGSPAAGKWQSSSSDEEAELHVQARGYLANFPPPGDAEARGEVGGGDGCEAGPVAGLASLPRELGEGASLENLSDLGCSLPEEPPCAKPWAPPKGFWKSARPETLLLNGDGPSAGERPPGGPPAGTGAQRRAWTASGKGARREIQRSDSLEGHLRSCVQTEAGLAAPLGGLWRADSWESVCSSGSSLSLAERVEMNRGILKQMLSSPRSKYLEGEHQAEDTAEFSGRGSMAPNDSDWDSGISLQGSENSQRCDSRAFVLSDDLPLSPRHEQAKRLLERARMKARSYPVKADHTILPIQRDNPEPSSRAGLPLRRAPLMGREGVAAVSGNLSDSSSGDSACGPRRRHGQSPTRVRFEDESEKDAEVRYLERLRQRRRAGERAQGPLVSKPNLSSYVNGRKEGETGAAAEANRASECTALWNKKTRRNQERGAVNGGTHNKAAPQEAAGRKCNSCGTVLEGASASHFSLNSNCHPTQTACEHNSQEKTVPVWVAPDLPDRTVRTERIKETYIGEVDGAGERDSGTENAGGGSAGERASTLGKLKRRSRKGDGRQEAGLGPYARMAAAGSCHGAPSPPEASARRPRRAAGALPPNPYASEGSGRRPASPAADGAPAPPFVEVSGHLPVKDTPPNALPIKSALKSGPKNRPSGQRVVKLVPSPEYRLIHLDGLEEPCSPEPSLPPGAAPEQPADPEALRQSLEERLCAALSYREDGPSLLKPCPPELSITSAGPAPCIRPSSLKYSPARGLCDYEVTDPWDPATEETVVGQYHQVNGELCLESVNVCSAPARGPMRAEHLREDSSDLTHGAESHKRVVFEGFDQRESKPKLSLRRFFSAMGLNSMGKHSKGRSSSMEQLSFSPKSSPASPNPTHKHYGQLKKAPSLQSLRMGSPFAQLRKASSVQNLQVPKKKGDRSSAYMPGDQPCSPAYSRGLQRALSVEDVGSPSAVRSVGRVSQAFPDGTLLLELRRPPNGPFGFLISRGKGRPDSGVYVEEMGDSSTQKLYAGLLGVGDEILEVSGEKVAGLSLDQVTRIMTQDCSTSIRVLRHRQAQR
ncbi:hypothetical protein SKAU_G00071040 [Synaphobranchus kaupii]|uniref:PDZ domain-containing protein n=1 Tax=Synaphobranchus kaupii TaxID=118154 RepID=A0A9Q1G7X1_SYNKA|nr:hypothetical protein SKAU_G00071040 [Synaphobranchus kaupii]